MPLHFSLPKNYLPYAKSLPRKDLQSGKMKKKERRKFSDSIYIIFKTGSI
jgi:hypothetical protein